MPVAIQANADGTATFRVNGVDAMSLSTSSLSVPAVSIAGTSAERISLVTAQPTTSGTFVDFTGIPTWAKKITVTFSGVSTNGTATVLVQVGSGSVTTTGYSSSATYVGGNTSVAINSTAGMIVQMTNSTDNRFGQMVFTNISGNTWVQSHSMTNPTSGSSVGAGGVTLSGALDRVRITTSNGTDVFDAGSVGLIIEG